MPEGQGLDLDCGRTTPRPDGPGADIAPQPGGRVIASDPYAAVAWLEGARTDDFAACAGLSPTVYEKFLDSTDRPSPPGRVICVRTSENNVAIVRVETPSTADSPSLGVRYLIRYQGG